MPRERRDDTVTALRALRRRNELTEARVLSAARELGVGKRTVWRWLERAERSGESSSRTGFEVTDEDIRELAFWQGNLAALHRARGDGPSIRTLRRAFGRAVASGRVGPGRRGVLRREDLSAAASTRAQARDGDGAGLLGRDGDLVGVGRELARRRLVVLTGPAGVGKTRLARELARRASGSFPDGIHVVELATVREPELVEQAVARALGIGAEPERGALVHELRGRRLLLVLDNCEHLAEACSELVTVLVDECPGLSILATSQISLDTDRAAVWAVAPLPVPGPTERAEAMAGTPAVALFCARAATARPGFTVDGESVRVVADICRQLDGLPLAIELAAARVIVLTPQELAERLDERLTVLTHPVTRGTDRHATLHLALDWSHDLLTAAERLLFRRLSVFVGPCDVVAVSAVCGSDGGDSNVLDPLTGLISKSLVLSDTTGERARYCMLETIRLYAAERLEEAGETAAIRRRHAAWFLDVSERAEPGLTGSDQVSAVDRLVQRHADLRAALRWSLQEGHAEVAMRLAGALTLFWRIRCLYHEGVSFLGRAIALDSDVALGVRAKALWGFGFLTLMHGRGWDTAGRPIPPHEQSRAALEAGLALARRLEDRGGEARAQLLLGNCAYAAHDGRRARELLQRSAALAAEASDPWCWSHALGMEARVLLDEGDLAGARPLVDRCLALGRQSSDLQSTRLGLYLLGEMEVALGNFVAAEIALEEALAIGSRLGEPELIDACQLLLANVRVAMGDASAAGTLVNEVMERSVSLAGAAWLRLGAMALDQGDIATATTCFERTCTQLDSDGKPPHDAVAGLGGVAALEGREADARALLTRARALAGGRASRNRMIAALTASLGRLARDRGDRPRAVSLHCQALEIFQEAGSAPGVVQSLEDLGALRCQAGAAEHAARLLGAATAMRGERRFARARALSARYDEDAAAVQAALGTARFEAAQAEGAALSIDEAAAYALKGWGSRTRSASGWDSLTRMEREIVALVREGLSNRQIADRLFVSPRTVGGHLVNIFAKLGIRTRAKLVVDAGHQGS